MKYILREHYGMKALFRDDETFVTTFAEDWVYDSIKASLSAVPGNSVFNAITGQYDVGNLDELLASNPRAEFQAMAEEALGVRRPAPGDYDR